MRHNYDNRPEEYLDRLFAKAGKEEEVYGSISEQFDGKISEMLERQANALCCRYQEDVKYDINNLKENFYMLAKKGYLMKEKDITSLRKYIGFRRDGVDGSLYIATRCQSGCLMPNFAQEYKAIYRIDMKSVREGVLTKITHIFVNKKKVEQYRWIVGGSAK